MPRSQALPLLVLTLAVLLPAPALQGQEIIPFAGGGVAAGTGDLGTDTDRGWFVLGGFDVPLPTLLAREASLRAGVSHARIPFTGDFGEETSVTSVSGEMVYHFGAASRLVRPYLRGGVALNVQRYLPGELPGPEVTDARVGLVAGAGFNLMLGPTDLVIGAHFTSGEDAGYGGLHGGLAIPLR